MEGICGFPPSTFSVPGSGEEGDVGLDFHQRIWLCSRRVLVLSESQGRPELGVGLGDVKGSTMIGS